MAPIVFILLGIVGTLIFGSIYSMFSGDNTESIKEDIANITTIQIEFDDKVKNQQAHIIQAVNHQHNVGTMTDATIKHNILADNIKEMIEDRIVNKDTVAAARTLHPIIRAAHLKIISRDYSQFKTEQGINDMRYNLQSNTEVRSYVVFKNASSLWEDTQIVSEIVIVGPEVDTNEYKMGKNGRMFSNNSTTGDINWINNHAQQDLISDSINKNLHNQVVGRRFTTTNRSAIVFMKRNNTLDDHFTVIQKDLNEFGTLTCPHSEFGVHTKRVHLKMRTTVQLPITCSLQSNSINATAVEIYFDNDNQRLKYKEEAKVFQDETVLEEDYSDDLDTLEDQLTDRVKILDNNTTLEGFTSITTDMFHRVAEGAKSLWAKFGLIPGNILAFGGVIFAGWAIVSCVLKKKQARAVAAAAAAPAVIPQVYRGIIPNKLNPLWTQWYRD